MNFHPDIELLLKYSSGQLAPALSVAISLHHQTCKQCQQRVADLETFGGSALETLPNISVDLSDFDRLLVDLDGLPEEPNDSEFTDLPVANIDKPLIKQLSEQQFSGFKWQRLSYNIWRANVQMQDPVYSVELLKFSPKAKIPQHTHIGKEFTYVLQGTFSDHVAEYRQGDFVTQDKHNNHQPKAGKDGCICLAITDSPIKFTGRFSSLLNWLNR